MQASHPPVLRLRQVRHLDRAPPPGVVPEPILPPPPTPHDELSIRVSLSVPAAEVHLTAQQLGILVALVENTVTPPLPALAVRERQARDRALLQQVRVTRHSIPAALFAASRCDLTSSACGNRGSCTPQRWSRR